MPVALEHAVAVEDILELRTAQQFVARGVLESASPVELLYGDGAVVLTHLGG